MTKSDLELFLNEFPVPGRKVFVYKQEFIPDHYVTIEKNFKTDKQGGLIKTEDETEFLYQYKINEAESTYIIPNFDNDLFFKLLMKEELFLPHESKWYMSITDFRTGGCTCGAWATTNPNLHTFDCRRYFK